MQPQSMTTITQGQDLGRYQSRMTLAAVGGQQKPSSRPSPVKSKSGIFPHRPPSSKLGKKPTEVPLFVPDEEDDAIPPVVCESEGDEWEDLDELEEAQMSIAITESLELQHRSRRASGTWAPEKTHILETPAKSSRRINTDEDGNAMADDEDEFASPSRLATQLTIAGARKPLSTRIPSDSVRRTAAFSTDTQFVSRKESTQSLTPNPVPGLSPDGLSKGDADGEGDSENDDMEEVTIPHFTEARSPVHPGPLVSPDPATVADLVEPPLAIGVEDVVAKRFAEFQKIFAEKRNAFRAENLEVPEIRQTPEVSRAYSPGLEYTDDEVWVTEAAERGKAAMKARSLPPPHSDEDEDMEEVEVVATQSVPPRIPQLSVNSKSPEPSIPVFTELPLPKHVEENANVGDEDVPISDWSRSPSPRPRPPAGEAGPSKSALTLDRSRGLLDQDELFEQPLPGEQDQEHDDFDAAHEMDPDAEAGEFARWMSQVKGRNLDEVRKEIEQEINVLRKEQKAAMRDSEDVTGQMITQIMVSLSNGSYRLCLST